MGLGKTYLAEDLDIPVSPKPVCVVKKLHPTMIDPEIIRLFAIKIDDTVYVLHAFKKKSPKGIKTPQQTIDLIQQRLQIAIQISQTRQS